MGSRLGSVLGSLGFMQVREGSRFGFTGFTLGFTLGFRAPREPLIHQGSLAVFGALVRPHVDAVQAVLSDPVEDGGAAVAPLPTSNSPASQVTFPFSFVTVPWLLSAETKPSPSGKAPSTRNPLARCGPRFVRVTV